MKTFLKTFFLLICTLGCVYACLLFAGAEGSRPDAVCNSRFHLKIQLFDDENAYTYIHEFQLPSGKAYYLFLPADCDRDHLIVFFDEEWFSVDGVSLVSGTKTDVFTDDGTHHFSTPAGSYALHVVSSAVLPSVYITTESGSLSGIHADKTFKESGTVSIAKNGNIILNHADLSYMKGRGNSSWKSNDKKSYTIKLTEKTEILGMSRAKKWVLTSNNMDPTLMRNAMAYSLAHETSIPYTVDYRFVDLFINGVFRGNYMLCEKIEVGKHRVNIYDLDKANESKNEDFSFSADDTNSVVCSDSKKWVNTRLSPRMILLLAVLP